MLKHKTTYSFQVELQTTPTKERHAIPPRAKALGFLALRSMKKLLFILLFPILTYSAFAQSPVATSRVKTDSIYSLSKHGVSFQQDSIIKAFWQGNIINKKYIWSSDSLGHKYVDTTGTFANGTMLIMDSGQWVAIDTSQIGGGGGGGGGSLWALDVNGDLEPINGTSTDTYWELDVNGDLEPKP